MRPDAVALVDAWAIPDFVLDSAIGRSDGDAYGALLAAAKREPLNAEPVARAVRAHLLPALRAGAATLASKL